MKYKDLIQFEPLTTNIQIADADHSQAARTLVETFVIAEEMADRLTMLILPQLQFEQPADNKGVLVVGNYGTGKSHLMSVLSAVAEHAELAGAIRNERVAELAASTIAGRFQVVRTELGSTTMNLRDFVCTQLERALAERGVEYRFPARDAIPNHKGAFEAMMSAFHERFPDQGLLIVVDELLEYLRSRQDQALVLDLGFLREIGEVCRDLKFRFVAGVQEMLFDSARFAFAADSIRRVRDRFEQVPIAQRDVKYVVAERLLRKTPEQQARIRSHLEPFARFYGTMHARLDEFVRLFPVHPDYLATFERITVVEKRAALRTLSRAMARLLGQDVPHDQPGIIAFDSYWAELQGDASVRTDPDIRQVLDCSTRLEALVDMNYPRGKNKELARRIIHGLSVHRLATGDITAPVGLTAEGLRDALCLYDPLVGELGGDPAEDLRGEVETALRLVSRTVNGEFLSASERDARGQLGGQFFLDVQKTVDFDAQIDRRAESLDDDALDRHYFEALKRVLECGDVAAVAGHRIWEHEIEWRDRKAPRRGWLFFGAPNQRSTAQPPLEYYIYFLPPFAPPRFRDARLGDEVFFRLAKRDDVFESAVRRYAAATLLWGVASGQEKTTYQRKADTELRKLVAWLQEQMATAFEVTHGGRARPLLDWVQGATVRERLGLRPEERANVRDVVNLVASLCLSPHFAERAPEYPAFSSYFTGEARPQAAADALRGLRPGQPRTKQASAVLDALELLDGNRLTAAGSRYAAWVRERMAAKGNGQVLNRGELLDVVHGVEYAAPDRFRLEPEWLAVVLGALVHDGDAVLAIPGRKFESGDLDALAATPVADLVQFKHVEPPRDWNLPALKALFELVGLPPGRAVEVTQGKPEPVAALQIQIATLVERLVLAQQQLLNGIAVGDQPLVSEAERHEMRGCLERTKTFLESLQALTVPGRLKNLRHSEGDVRSHADGLATLREIAALLELAESLRPLAAYLTQAELALPPEHPWRARAASERREAMARLTDPTGRSSAAVHAEVRRSLQALKVDYVREYAARHGSARLDARLDGQKRALLVDPRLATLRSLATLPLMSVGHLSEVERALDALRPCFALTAEELERTPICPHCHFSPAMEPQGGGDAAARLEGIDGSIDTLVAEGTKSLCEALEHPATRDNVALLPSASRSLVEDVVRSGRLPVPIPPALIEALADVLRGLTKVTVRMDELRTVLGGGGAAASPAELRRRFEEYLAALMRGTDAERVRIVVE